MRYWFEEENFALVQKDARITGPWTQSKFEYYIDERVRMFLSA